MTDTHDEVPERKDPVLVRPYIGGGFGDDESTGEPETWPETATLPEPAAPSGAAHSGGAHPGGASSGGLPSESAPSEGLASQGLASGLDGQPQPDVQPGADLADTVVQPAVPAIVPAGQDAPRRPGLSVTQRLLVLCGGVALALGVVAYLLLGTGDGTGRQPGTALPAYTGGVPTAAQVTGTPRPSGSVSASVSPSVSALVSVSVSVSISASLSASAAVAASVSASISAPNSAGTSAPTSAPASPAAPTLDPAPGADRTGAVTAASGRCLNLGGLLGIDGSPVQVAGCTGGSAQRFTLATDGTLRVGTRCAQTTGDGTVRVTGCDDRASAQWRGGPGGTVVNPASGQCLTDPGRAGATTTATACSGGTDQTWSLP